MTIWSAKWCWRFREKKKLPQKFERKRQLSLIDHLTDGEIEELREINAFIEEWYDPEADDEEFGTTFRAFNWLRGMRKFRSKHLLGKQYKEIKREPK